MSGTSVHTTTPSRPLPVPPNSPFGPYPHLPGVRIGQWRARARLWANGLCLRCGKALDPGRLYVPPRRRLLCKPCATYVQTRRKPRKKTRACAHCRGPLPANVPRGTRYHPGCAAVAEKARRKRYWTAARKAEHARHESRRQAENIRAGRCRYSGTRKVCEPPLPGIKTCPRHTAPRRCCRCRGPLPGRCRVEYRSNVCPACRGPEPGGSQAR